RALAAASHPCELVREWPRFSQRGLELADRGECRTDTADLPKTVQVTRTLRIPFSVPIFHPPLRWREAIKSRRRALADDRAARRPKHAVRQCRGRTTMFA